MTSRDDTPLFALHQGGKIEVVSTVPLRNRDDLSLAYTPGVAEVCMAIHAEPDLVNDYTWKNQVVAVVTDGTAVLGLGDIGPEASLPVMEGKALLFKQFGGVDSVPIALATKDVDEIVETVIRLAPSFGGINLEDISAPRCFEIEDRLKAALDIPVFHDDQHGTAIVALAAMKSATRADRPRPGGPARRRVRCGRSGVAVSKILLEAGIGDIAIADSKGMIHAGADRPHRRSRRTMAGDHQHAPTSPARSRTRWSAPTSSSACRPARSTRPTSRSSRRRR